MAKKWVPLMPIVVGVVLVLGSCAIPAYFVFSPDGFDAEVMRGQSTSVTFSVKNIFYAPADIYNFSVSFSGSSPSGVTASFYPSSLTGVMVGQSRSITVTFKTINSSTAGSYYASINATAECPSTSESFSSSFCSGKLTIKATNYTLTTNVDGNGTVSGGGSYTPDTNATIEAHPDQGYEFDYWSGDISGSSNPAIVLMNSDKTVTAHFTYSGGDGGGDEIYILTTSVVPIGSGSVHPSLGTYSDGQEVTLTATPYSGYVFEYWGGDAYGASQTLTITMDGDMSVVANFKKSSTPMYTLSSAVSPNASGSISPAFGSFEEGESVTLTATPSDGFSFDHWSGDASGTPQTVTLVMNRDKAAIANFVPIETSGGAWVKDIMMYLGVAAIAFGAVFAGITTIGKRRR